MMGAPLVVGDARPMSAFATTILQNKKYAHEKGGGNYESWSDVADRLAGNVVQPYLPSLAPRIRELIYARKFIPGGRYLYAAGRRYPQVNNCFMFKVQDSREGWADLLQKCANALMTGGGVGVVYSDLREENAPILGMGGTSTGPIALMNMINECARHIIQGGSRRSALWAGLRWDHPDVFKFIRCKDWSDDIRACKKNNPAFPAPMEGTNISVILNTEFFAAYSDVNHQKHWLSHDVYWASVRGMLKSGEPGLSVDIGDNEGENLRNACTEATSRDDSDMCNLGSINLARISSLEEMVEVVELGTAFLMCGTLYSRLPVPEMYKVREKNRRLGLGLMGAHEWLVRRGRPYGPDEEMENWLRAYALSGAHANRYADRLSTSRPVATRSIAPTGTISIIGETTSGIEPIYATAYRRRYLEGTQWKAQYVVDAAAKRLIDDGIDPNLIEDANSLAEDVERRVAFQAWLQRYVDQGIASTINLPEWGSSVNNEGTVTRFGTTLLNHLPQIRGITAYPNGARDGQPLVSVPYTEAVQRLGTIYQDHSESSCKSGVCSS